MTSKEIKHTLKRLQYVQINSLTESALEQASHNEMKKGDIYNKIQRYFDTPKHTQHIKFIQLT